MKLKKVHYLNEIEKGVAIIYKSDNTEHIIFHEKTGSMPAGDITYFFVEDGELKNVKTKESPILPLTDHALKRLNEDWTFNV